MSSFPDEDVATWLQGLDLGQSTPRTCSCTRYPQVKSHLQVLWVLTSLFDPLGFAVLFSIEYCSNLREISSDACDWDEQLPKKAENVGNVEIFSKAPASAEHPKDVHLKLCQQHRGKRS